ncbi:uncharacterized protein LOC133329245 [Musca vetustissima]|uniref:uncharacterized protein LOC133329245 n=1 Tax=Musca vetustissima TaxID=27455 RepID=UPI002AB6CC81|nr:uncharacterized protein LOC133329245 [Musca vetustissima]
MSKVLITEETFKQLNYDMEKSNIASATSDGNRQPTVMIIFENSDINAALHHLTTSLQNPLCAKAMASVLVQESIRADFEQKLQAQLKAYAKDDAVTKCDQLKKALETITKINAKVITVVGGPTVVCDFTHEHFGGSQVAGICTLHTFRTAKEAISLVGKETLTFQNVSIWHENHAYAYELVAALKSQNFFINCYNMPLTVLQDHQTQGKSFVAMEKNYHYETLPHNGIQKSIVFPIGSIFAN